MHQKQQKKWMEFLAEKGFYIILILCIAAIGISGYVLFFSGSDEPDQDMLSIGGETEKPQDTQPKATELQTEIPDYAIRDTQVIMASPEPSEAEPEEPVTEDAEDAEPVSNNVSEGVLSGQTGSDAKDDPVTASFFVWPVNGELLEKFSIDELVFNETLDDWRVHPGVDIAANLGTQISAIGDGVVEDVYTDEMMGVTIVIDHGNGIKSVYKNLMDSVTVGPNDTVYAGDVIGGVGQTADQEYLQSPHLHLEVIKDGAQIDPCEVLP